MGTHALRMLSLYYKPPTTRPRKQKRGWGGGGGGEYSCTLQSTKLAIVAATVWPSLAQHQIDEAELREEREWEKTHCTKAHNNKKT